MTRARFRPVRLFGTLLAGGVVAALLAWPQLIGWHQALILSQLVAFRGAVAVALGVGAVVGAVVAVRRRTWGVAAGLAVALAVASVAQGAALLGRGTDDSALPAGDLTVAAWNTLGGAADAATVARLVLDVEADIVSLPEMDEHAAAEVAALVAAGGHPMTAHTTHGDTGHSEFPLSVLIADHLGAYAQDASAGSTPDVPSGVWRSVDGTGPTVVAAHPYPPLPWAMGSWQAGLQWVADQCATPDVIVAGDLNATVDHLWGLGDGLGGLGACQDAAIAAGAGALGTWPTAVPPWLGAPIDHVLFGSAWSVRDARVLTSFDRGASDHRPIVAVLDAR